jgi:hypothetical protein
MKGDGEVEFILKLETVLEVREQTHRKAALPQGIESPPCPFDRMLGGSHNSLEPSVKRKISFFALGKKHRSPGFFHPEV